MGLQFDGVLRLRAQGSETEVRGAGDCLYITGSLSPLRGEGPSPSLGPLARLADRWGVTVCVDMAAGFELRLGRRAKRGVLAGLVGGPASVGRTGALR